jgi:hypothetical protein
MDFYLRDAKSVKLTGQQVVEPSSGFIRDAYEGTDHIPADHCGMVRFKNDRETGYRRVSSVVRRFVDDATKDVTAGKLPRQLAVNGV